MLHLHAMIAITQEEMESCMANALTPSFLAFLLFFNLLNYFGKWGNPQHFLAVFSPNYSQLSLFFFVWRDGDKLKFVWNPIKGFHTAKSSDFFVLFYGASENTSSEAPGFLLFKSSKIGQEMACCGLFCRSQDFQLTLLYHPWTKW